MFVLNSAFKLLFLFMLLSLENLSEDTEEVIYSCKCFIFQMNLKYCNIEPCNFETGVFDMNKNSLLKKNAQPMTVRNWEIIAIQKCGDQEHTVLIVTF